MIAFVNEIDRVVLDKYEADIGEGSARINRVKTLNNSVIFNVGGYCHGDREFTITAQTTQAQEAILRNFLMTNAILNVFIPEGAFEGYISKLRTNNGKSDINILIEKKNSDLAEVELPQAPTPAFIPDYEKLSIPVDAAVYMNAYSVAGFSAYYTIDGSDPDFSSYLFIDDGDPISLMDGEVRTIKAFSFKEGYEKSDTFTRNYYCQIETIPVITITEGTGTAQINIACNYSSYFQIRYRIEGTSITDWTNYVFPVSISTAGTYMVFAKLSRKGWIDSDISSKEFAV